MNQVRRKQGMLQFVINYHPPLSIIETRYTRQRNFVQPLKNGPNRKRNNYRETHLYKSTLK